MKQSMQKSKWVIVYTLLLAAFTLYIVLDTFLIPRVYTVVPNAENAGSSSAQDSASSQQKGTAESQTTNTGSPFTQSVVRTENSYSDPNISITITAHRENNTTIYVADVYVSSSAYLKTAFAKQSYGKNITEKTSEIAQASGAILAVNGDYYGAQTKGYVLRNGILYRESAGGNQEDLVIGADGSFEIITEGTVSAAQLLEQGAAQVLSFGPALLVNSELSVTERDEVDRAKTSNPRTAIGIVDDLHYMFVVSDGRTEESQGLTLLQLAVFMQGQGVKTAYNLDGGGSSTMYFNGAVVNHPTSSGNSIKERSVSDIVYIG